MNTFVLIKDIYQASEAGKEIANPANWANRASVISNMTILLTVVFSLLKDLINFDMGLNQDEIGQVAAGITVLGFAISNRLHIAANPNAGTRKSEAVASLAEVAVRVPVLEPLTGAAGKAAQETATILEDVTKPPEPN